MAKNAPIRCPKCKHKNVIEIADGIVAKHSYDWDSKIGKYVLKYEDEENYGELYIECAQCDYRYSQSSYDKFANKTIDINT
jgi:hypothetical protein